METPPERIGPYPIERELGRGGMGVVYLGRDPALGRPVAVKVLPEAMASDPERLARFDREARMLAAVHHPNVASIFGVGEDGQEGGTPRRYLALEYVPGESLAERLARAPLPVGDALAVCRQIAAGLEAAHEAGVVHRDLKPANVRITPDGAAKVLDFGLAKGITASSSVSGSFAESPTRTYLHATTEKGVVLGTLTYMSPEQASGKPVDRRTDVWALGCILFECLSGRAPFAGNNATDAMVKILEREPPWEKLPATTPPRVVELLHRCLEKDRNQRLRDAGDARLELERAERVPDSAGAVTAKRRAARDGGWARLVGCTLGVAALTSAATWWLARGPLAAPAPTTHLSIVLPADLVVTGLPKLDATGRTLFVRARARTAAGSEWRIYRRPLDRDTLEPIPGTERAVAFLPIAGGRLFFVAPMPGDENDQAFTGPMDGGAPPSPLFPVRPAINFILPLADGGFVAGADLGRTLSRLGPGGSPGPAHRVELGFDAVVDDARAALADGRSVLATFGRSSAKGYRHGTAAVDLETGKGTVVLEDGNAQAVTADGTLLFTRGSVLLGAPFDETTLKIVGPEVTLVEGVRAPGFWIGGSFAYAGGTLAFATGGDVTAERQLVACEPGGTCAAMSRERRRFVLDALRSHGDGVLATVTNPRGNFEVWRFERDGSSQSLVAIPGRDTMASAASSDGRSIAYRLGDTGRGDDAIVVVPAQGGTPVPVLAGKGVTRPWPEAWLPDGRSLIVHTEPRGGGQADLLLVDVASPATSRPLLATEMNETFLALSPDGRWLAYASNATGQQEGYLAELRPDGSLGRPILLAVRDPVCGAFAADGRTLFVNDGNQILRVRLDAAGKPGEPEPVLDVAREHLLPQLAVLRDGRLAFVREGAGEATISRVDVVLGFDEAVRRRVRSPRRQ
jgi:hypothetical protein